MSFLKFDFTRSSPSPSKKGRSALSATSLIKQTEQELKSNIEKSRSITPFGQYKTCSFVNSFTFDDYKDSLSTNESKKSEKTLLENLIYEIFNKCFDEYKTKVTDQITSNHLNYFTSIKDFNNWKNEITSKYSELSKKMNDINVILSKNEPLILKGNGQNEENKELQKCLSYRSELIDNDIEENTENFNQIKFLENNINNLRWKDSTKKSETINSKKNSNVWENNFDANFLIEEMNKLRLKIDNLEKSLEKNEIALNGHTFDNPLQLRLASSNTKNKKQESLEGMHQQTPSFDQQRNDFKFSIVTNSDQKIITNKYENYENDNNLDESSDLYQTELEQAPQKTLVQAELIKNDSGIANNNDYSPALSQNQHVETFQEKYLIDKIALVALENPLNDDYLKKKKSINDYHLLKEEDILLRVSYIHKSIDDFEVTYENNDFVPLFNFNSNKSQFTSHNSKKESVFKSNMSELDNDAVELGTNETKSASEIDDLALTGKFQQFEEKDHLFRQKEYKSEIKEAELREEGDDNDDVIIYHLDENNYFMDENGAYICDENNKQLKISIENLDYLRKSFVIENN